LAAELQTSHWRFLMGAVGNQATYIRQLNRVMKSLRDDLTLDGLRDGIESSSMPDHLKTMAKMRLNLAAKYINDSVRLKDAIRPGRLITRCVLCLSRAEFASDSGARDGRGRRDPGATGRHRSTFASNRLESAPDARRARHRPLAA
jgi:hypothetical protein